MKQTFTVAGFLCVALMSVLCLNATAQYPDWHGHHYDRNGHDWHSPYEHGHEKYDGHGYHAYEHAGYTHSRHRRAGQNRLRYRDPHAIDFTQDRYADALGIDTPEPRLRFYGPIESYDSMAMPRSCGSGYADCPFAQNAPRAGATPWQHGDHSHGNSFANPHGHADGMQRRGNPDFAVPNRPSQNRDNTYIPQPSLSQPSLPQNRDAVRGNASDAIVMDGPPPSLDGITPSSSGESSPSHDHAGHDHEHAGHEHAH